MQQYFIQDRITNQTRVLMSQEQAHHISHVMRMHEAQQIRVVDVDGMLYLGSIHYQDAQVYAILQGMLQPCTHTNISITLLAGMIKKDKWDMLLQKSAELGVDTIVPFTSSRCVVKISQERMDKKLQRWQSILQEACEQSKRVTLVKLHEPCEMHRALHFTSDVNLIAYEDADAISEKLSAVLKRAPHAKSVTIAIGCEGGFSKAEVASFVEAGYHRISLGHQILRSETAAMACINSTSFFYEMAGEENEILV